MLYEKRRVCMQRDLEKRPIEMTHVQIWSWVCVLYVKRSLHIYDSRCILIKTYMCDQKKMYMCQKRPINMTQVQIWSLVCMLHVKRSFKIRYMIADVYLLKTVCIHDK